jgi:hypothetical protein
MTHLNAACRDAMQNEIDAAIMLENKENNQHAGTDE